MENKEKEIIISLRDICKKWDDKIALEDINFDVHRGDFIAITGPNGGGKTTLLRILLRLLKPTSGSVTYFRHGKAVDDLSIGYLPQKNMIDSRFPISVEEVIASGLIAESPGKEEMRRRVSEVTKLMGLENHSSQTIGNLSGGQLQRALLGRAIIARPRVLVLDEPLSYVDKRFEHYIYDIVAELSHSTTLLLVSHEMSTIAGMANRHLIIDHRLTECHSSHHQVHYDCDDDDGSSM